MRHTLVTRVAAVLSLLLLVAALLFAWTRAGRAAAPPAATRARPLDGAAVFAGRCAGCHAAQDLAGRLRAAPDRARAAVELLEFLETHGAGDAAE
jgi:mono/diheme cytochrome c family protein